MNKCFPVIRGHTINWEALPKERYASFFLTCSRFFFLYLRSDFGQVKKQMAHNLHRRIPACGEFSIGTGNRGVLERLPGQETSWRWLQGPGDRCSDWLNEGRCGGMVLTVAGSAELLPPPWSTLRTQQYTAVSHWAIADTRRLDSVYCSTKFRQGSLNHYLLTISLKKSRWGA